MNAKILERYMNTSIAILKNDLDLIKNVGIDNMYEIMNTLFKFNYTYEVQEINDDLAIVILYTPFGAMTGLAQGTGNKVESINRAVLDAFKKKMLKLEVVDITPDVTNNKVKDSQEVKKEDKSVVQESNVQTSTLDEIENDIKKEESNNVTNLNEIRQDQVAFINEFKAKNNIDTDKKLNYYIKTWSDNTGYEIYDKVTLIKSGGVILDKFIEWLKVIQANDIVNRNISSPI